MMWGYCCRSASDGAQVLTKMSSLCDSMHAVKSPPAAFLMGWAQKMEENGRLVAEKLHFWWLVVEVHFFFVLLVGC